MQRPDRWRVRGRVRIEPRGGCAARPGRVSASSCRRRSAKSPRPLLSQRPVNTTLPCHRQSVYIVRPTVIIDRITAIYYPQVDSVRRAGRPAGRAAGSHRNASHVFRQGAMPAQDATSPGMLAELAPQRGPDVRRPMRGLGTLMACSSLARAVGDNPNLRDAIHSLPLVAGHDHLDTDQPVREDVAGPAPVPAPASCPSHLSAQ